MRKKFKTVQEGVEFWDSFTCPLFGKASQMSDYYYNKLDKLGELEWNYKKKNEIIWDMFGDWEEVISEIDWDIHMIYVWYWEWGEKQKLAYLNEMLEWYEWYLD